MRKRTLAAHTERRLVALALVASLVFRIAVVAHDVRYLAAHGPLLDDSFYAFKIAGNIAAGKGSTFDGVHPTNGYQPLYVLALVPLYLVSGGDQEIPIHVALSLSAVLSVLTGLLLYRLVRRHASFEAAFLGLILWGFGAVVVRHSLNGLETSLAMFLLALSLHYYLTVYRPRREPGGREVATLGVLLGLSVLARFDAILFIAAVAADQLWTRRSSWAPLLRSLTVVLLILLPWSLANELAVGRVMPDSGTATRLLSEEYASHDVPAVVDRPRSVGASGDLLRFNVVQSVLLLGTTPAALVLTRSLELGLRAAHAGTQTMRTILGIFVVALTALGLYASHSRRWTGKAALSGEYVFLYLYAFLLIAAYCFVVFGQIFFSRYYYPVFFLSVIVSVAAFDTVLQRIGRVSTRARRVIAFAVLAVYAILTPRMAYIRLQGTNYGFVHVADWIAAHTAPSTRIGIFNCGAVGYFSDRVVINLDGKVNPAALDAIRKGTMHDYIRSEGIDYVIDHGWILRHFLLDQPFVPPDVHLSLVAEGAELGSARWEAYRVVRADEAGPPAPSVASSPPPPPAASSLSVTSRR